MKVKSLADRTGVSGRLGLPPICTLQIRRVRRPRQTHCMVSWVTIFGKGVKSHPSECRLRCTGVHLTQGGPIKALTPARPSDKCSRGAPHPQHQAWICPGFGCPNLKSVKQGKNPHNKWCHKFLGRNSPGKSGFCKGLKSEPNLGFLFRFVSRRHASFYFRLTLQKTNKAHQFFFSVWMTLQSFTTSLFRLLVNFVSVSQNKRRIHKSMPTILWAGSLRLTNTPS